MKRTTASLVTGALAAGTFATLATLAPAMASATECGTTTVNQFQLDDWFVPALSDTRATGHYEITADNEQGLRVYTEGTSSTDKVAEYVDAGGILLASQTAQSNYDINYISNHGQVGPGTILPGYQLIVDFDGNGTADGILVGEDVYGDDWWLNNAAAGFVNAGAPNTGGGSGSNWFGTLDEWVASFPEAKIGAFGFSLGSGVYNDVVIDSITFGCNVLDFGYANQGPAASYVETDSADNNYRTFTYTSDSTDPEGDELTNTWTITGPNGSVPFTTNGNGSISVTYPAGPGTYSVTLSVSDGELSDSVTKTRTLTPPAPNTVGGAHLPNTGASVIGLAAITGLAVAGGATGTVVSRRRRNTSAV